MADDARRVWTDGACQGNPGPGGWGWVDDTGRWASGAEAQSTNQRMEIMAAYRAVVDHAEPLTVISDSTYVVHCFRDRWWEGWLKRDWKNSQRKPVANRDLWEPFVELVRSRGDVDFEWVKGHAGDEMNDIADRLAVAAAATQTERFGDQVPDDLGEADVILARPASAEGTPPRSVDRDRRLPPGRLVGVFGARPPELGGYDANPIADAVGRRLQEIVAAKQRLDTDLRVVSGLRLGAEMLGAEAAVAEGVPLVAVLPFPEADRPWPEASRRRFRQLIDAAEVTITLERTVPDTNAKVGAALRRRDAWLARNIDEAIVVWDGTERFAGRLVTTLRDRLGDEVWEEPIPG